MQERLRWYLGARTPPNPTCFRRTYVWKALEEALRIDERILKTVVFIGVEGPRGFTPYGTAMLGSVECEGYWNTVLVTCSHVVEQVPGDLISVRINRKDGTSECRGFYKEFLSFENRAIDLCLAPIALDPTIYDIFPVPLSTKIWLDGVEQEGMPSVGDEVVAVGLYTTHFGYIRNRPVIRMGHLAGNAMLEEEVMTNRGHVGGFLVECHSIAGLSGSPVFRIKDVSKIEDGKIIKGRGYAALGIMIGYHVIESKEDEIAVTQFQDEYLAERDERGVDERRTGFAVVLPMNYVYRLAESEEYMKRTKAALDEFKKKSGFREASAALSKAEVPASDENPNHQEDFRRLLGAAARTQKSED